MTTAQLVRVQGEGVQGSGPGDATADLTCQARVVDEVPVAEHVVVGRGAVPIDRRRRVLAAALACVAERGIAGTTADDIARRADCSRATLYRLFPGGMDAVLVAMAEAEVGRCLARLAEVVDQAGTLADALVIGIVGAGRLVTGHPVLVRLLADEPGVILPLVTFEREERLLAAAARWAAPSLVRWLDPGTAARVGEWMARIVDAYALDAAAAPRLTDEAWVRRLVTTVVLPGVAAMAQAAATTDIPTGPGLRAVPGQTAGRTGTDATGTDHSHTDVQGTEHKGAAR